MRRLLHASMLAAVGLLLWGGFVVSAQHVRVNGAASNVIVGGTSSISWVAAALMRSPADGVITLSNNAQTAFTRLGLGGITAAFPAIARSGTAIEIELADGTGAIRLKPGTPAVSVCGDGALQTGSTDTAGRVVGTTQTGCTLTFSTTFGGNSADCVMANLIANRGFINAASATAFTVTGLTAGDDFMYWCAGR